MLSCMYTRQTLRPISTVRSRLSPSRHVSRLPTPNTLLPKRFWSKQEDITELLIETPRCIKMEGKSQGPRRGLTKAIMNRYLGINPYRG